MAGLDPIGVIPPGALIGPTGGIVDGLRMYDHKLDLYDIDNVWVSLSPTEFRVVVPDYATTPGGDFGITFENGSALPITFDIGETGLYDVTDKTVKAPPSYVDSLIAVHTTANGNTVVNNGLVEAEGADIPLAPAPQVSMQPARTTLIAWSRDLTNAVWVGVAARAYDSVGMEGLANSASRVTDGSTTVLQEASCSSVIANDSGTYTQRYFIEKDEDESRYPSLGLDLFGGTTQRLRVRLNTKTGATEVHSTTGVTAHEAILRRSWWEVLISVDNNSSGNIGAQSIMAPARGSTLFTNDVTATGSIIVGNVELYENKTIEQIRGTAPIFTEAAAVSVDNDLIEVSGALEWAPQSLVAIFAFTPQADWTGLPAEAFVVLGNGADASLFYRNNNIDGLISHPPNTQRISGNNPGEEIIASVIWSPKLNAQVIGYKKGEAVFAWDTSPAAYQAKTYTDALEICRTLAGAATVRSLLIYDGDPPGTESLADVQAWVEANAADKINERQS